jgi:hypothetical protein
MEDGFFCFGDIIKKSAFSSTESGLKLYKL